MIESAKTIIYQQDIATTGSLLVEQIKQDPHSWQDKAIELWLYEGAFARQALTEQFNALGVQVLIRSAYKPLLHWFIEEVHATGLDQNLASIEISYPVDPVTDRLRFLSEAYPLDLLCPEVPLSWVALAPSAEHQYQVRFTYEDGATRSFTVFAPNESFKDHLNIDTLAPTGYLKVMNKTTGHVLQALALHTEIQLAYRSIMQAIKDHAWGTHEPYFERLHIRVDLPGSEVFSAKQDFLASTYEALHEDLYFSILEFFQHYSGRPTGDRGLQPGQIVPDIRVTGAGDGSAIGINEVSIQITCFETKGSIEPLIALPAKLADVSASGALGAVDQALTHRQVDDALNHISGDAFAFESWQGRTLHGKHRPGSLPGIVVTGGQHANESTGVVGALRGAQWLESVAEANFAVVPLENPDGYQLFHEYCAIHPRHINHAARYTALGDDQEYRERAPWFERQGRMHALRVTDAQLHLSLHGYPAHEWTRPFSGYLPRGFELWSVPKGFFLIVRYRDGWQEKAAILLDKLVEGLAAVPGLSAYNAEQLKRYETYSGPVPFEVKRGIPCLFTRNDKQTPGVVIVTEIPDETIYGEAFTFAHEVHTETVKLASTIWWQLMSDPTQ